jgi:hypothetical protein
MSSDIRQFFKFGIEKQSAYPRLTPVAVEKTFFCHCMSDKKCTAFLDSRLQGAQCSLSGANNSRT